tara:strand:+ start:404 stop:925 length:522 start_codon:yes stop_codon:yes gene_type:complete
VKKIFLLIFFILFSVELNAKIKPPFENIITLNEPKDYGDITFENFEGKSLSLKDYKSNIYILNFWATWCAPCKKEMPSLDKLQIKEGINIFAINIEGKNQNKTRKFFKDLNIKNLSIFFDLEFKLSKLLNLRGIPTTVILNKDRREIARIIGDIDFNDSNFINWLSIISKKNN